MKQTVVNHTVLHTDSSTCYIQPWAKPAILPDEPIPRWQFPICPHVRGRERRSYPFYCVMSGESYSFVATFHREEERSSWIVPDTPSGKTFRGRDVTVRQPHPTSSSLHICDKTHSDKRPV